MNMTLSNKYFFGPLFLIILFLHGLTTASYAQTKVNPLLKCLALEEEKYHKIKVHNSRSKLNIELLNEIAQTSELQVKEQYLNQICAKNEANPAERLLEFHLVHGLELFELGGSSNERNLKVATISEYQRQLPQVLMRHLANLQSELAIANCLEKNIPEIKKISEKIKYLEEDLALDTLKPHRKDITVIFNKLKNFAEIKRNCRQKPEQKKTKE